MERAKVVLMYARIFNWTQDESYVGISYVQGRTLTEAKKRLAKIPNVLTVARLVNPYITGERLLTLSAKQVRVITVGWRKQR